jgi:glycosyltransferase involved in cell wall biosynthesis
VKLFVQIPCYNEEATLPLVVRSIPRAIPGVDEVRILVVDDGSTDRTAAVARGLGVDYVVAHRRNRGLAAAFQTGLEACLRLGADVVVNTDGDNQYPQQEIPRLIRPILEGRADMVVGDRRVQEIEHFSGRKKLLQKLGSWTVRRFSGARVADAPSGFRAFSREVAERLNVVSTYSYTLDTLIQAGRTGMTIVNVPVRTNPPTRESRLIKGNREYVARSAGILLRVYAMYEPLRVFSALGLALVLIGLGFVGHWAYFYYVQPAAEPKVQSLIAAAALAVIGFQVAVMGLLASLIGANRRLLEQLLYRVKRLERAATPAEFEAVAARADRAAERPEARLVR